MVLVPLPTQCSCLGQVLCSEWLNITTSPFIQGNFEGYGIVTVNRSYELYQHQISCTVSNSAQQNLVDFLTKVYMWQSWIKIYYSVTYFEHITDFNMPQCWTSAKGGAHACLTDVSDIHAFTKHVWALPLAETQHYSTSKSAMPLKYVTK